MKIDTTANRLKEALQLRNMRQIDLVNKTKPIMKEFIPNYDGDGIDKTLLNKYINNIATPKQDNIYILSKALNVNEAWLMGYDVPIERIPDNQRIPKDEILQQKIENLSEEQKDIINKMIDNMK